MPLHNLVAIELAYQFIKENSKLQAEISKKIELFRTLTISLKHNMVDSSSAIQAIIIGGNTEAKEKANQLKSKGFDVRAILSPTVKKGSERLRICLHTYNTDEEIKLLAQLLINN